MATTVAAEEAPKPVVIYPVMAGQIIALFVFYSLAVIAMFVYVAYLQFSIDGPSWEAFAWTAGGAPFFITPLCFVPWLRDIFIRTYAAQGTSNSTEGDDLSNNLGPKNV